MEWVYNPPPDEPTVYETSSPPKSPVKSTLPSIFASRLPVEEPASEPEIEPEYIGDELDEQLISPEAAFEKFAGRVFLTSNPPDFSGCIYSEASIPTPVAPSLPLASTRDVLPKESRSERLARLSKEVEALAQETYVDSDNSDTLSDLASLRDQLSLIESSITNGATATRMLPKVAHSLSTESDAVTVQFISANPQHLCSLERRVAALEAMVGPQHLEASKPLWELVSDVEDHMALLRDPELPKMLRRDAQDIAAVLQQELHQERGADLLRTAAILDKMEKWEATAGSVPLVVERLRSLKRVQQEATCFVDTLAKVAAQVDRIERRRGENKELIENVRRNLENNLATVKENLDILHSRLEKD